MRKAFNFVIVLLALSLCPAADRSGERKLQEAIDRMETKGDLPGAIRLFEDVTKSADRNLAARALLYLGDCRDQLGKDGAEKAYERIVREYADQKELAGEAHLRLAALRKPGENQAGLTVRRLWAGPGVDTGGSISADGRYLSFVDWETGDLAVRDLATGRNRRLTNKGSWDDSDEFALTSVFSGNGRQIAYNWYGKDGSCDLRVVNIDGSGSRVLARCEAEDYPEPIGWSQDGKWIQAVFFRKESSRVEFANVSAADGAVRIAQSRTWTPELGGGGAVSPDGRHIVFGKRMDAAARHDLYVTPADGKHESRLTDHPADDTTPIWTLDGRAVIFASDRGGAMGFWMVEVADGKPAGSPRPIKTDVGQLDRVLGLSRSGSLYYALNAGMRDIYTVDLDPASGKAVGQPVRLAGRVMGANMGPVWSPDGKLLAYHSQRGPRMNVTGGLVIVIRNVPTGEEREIKTNLIQRGPVHWFPDGQSLLVPAYRARRQPLEYYRIDLRTGAETVVRRSAGGSDSNRPDLSPDGRTIFFTHTEGGADRRTVVLSYDMESGQEKQLFQVENGRYTSSVLVSPDGRQFAYVEWSGGHANAVSVAPVSGGEPRRVFQVQRPLTLPGNEALAWTRDSRHLLVSKTVRPERSSEVLRVPIAGGEPQQTGITMKQIYFGDAHPDGRHIAFYAGPLRETAKEIWVMENFLPDVGATQ